MVFVACGLNHKTAPLDVREQFALMSRQENNLLKRFLELPEIHEAAILSTCNRTEFYYETPDPNCIFSWLSKNQPIQPSKLSEHLYLHQDHDGIKHTLRVATGLDSMMLGEPQIFGQMKQAYLTAKLAGTIGPNLRHTFQYIFRASKRVRHQSGIGQNPVSVAYAAAQLIEQYFSGNPHPFPSQHKPHYQKKLDELTVFLIGSGDTATLVAKYLHERGVRRFTVANRTVDTQNPLTRQYAEKIVAIVDIPLYLPQADVVISATTCPLPFISQTMVKQALIDRNDTPIFLLDLAMPRDIEPAVAALDGVTLYNIDDLQHLIEHGVGKRKLAAVEAEKLIELELDNYTRWHRSLKAKHLICDYRNHMQDLAELELERAMQKLSAGLPQYDVLKDFSQRLVNKLTHRPTIGLKQAALDQHNEFLDLAHYLLNTTKRSHEEIT